MFRRVRTITVVLLAVFLASGCAGPAASEEPAEDSTRTKTIAQEAAGPDPVEDRQPDGLLERSICRHPPIAEWLCISSSPMPAFPADDPDGWRSVDLRGRDLSPWISAMRPTVVYASPSMTGPYGPASFLPALILNA